jgi:formylglycine-generating enzyme required for sulfatase activity
MKSNAFKLRSIIAIALIAVFGFLMITCDTGNSGNIGEGGGDSVGVVGKTSTGNDLIVMDTDMLNSKLKSVSQDGTLTFDNLDAEYTPVKGDIICAGPSTAAPYGFLYKVTTVTTDGEETVITTEMATIAEAVEYADDNESFDMDFAEGEIEEIEGVEVEFIYEDPDETPRFVSSSKETIAAVELKINKKVKEVTLTGNIKLSTKINWSIEVDGFSVKNFELSAEPRLKAEITASIDGKLEKEKEFKIYNHEFPSIKFMAGPLPVWVTPKVSIVCVVSAEGEVEVSAKLASWDYSIVFGVQKKKGSKLDAFQRNTSQPAEYLKGLEINLNGEVKVEPKAGFMFGLYGMAYAGISGGFYARLAGESDIFLGVNSNASATLSLFCGIEFIADAELEVLEYTVGELHKTFYTKEWLIWEKTWSTTAVTGVTLNKTTLSLTSKATEQLIATVLPSNATNKDKKWTSSDPSVATVGSSGTVTAVRPGTATIAVTTVDGMKTATCTVTVTAGSTDPTDPPEPIDSIIEMVQIPAGTFKMGSPETEPNRFSGETQHSVTLSSFKMSKYQVTQEQYQAVMGHNPSYFNSNPEAGETQGKRPVEYLTWYDAVELCNKLSVLEGLQEVYTINDRSPASGYPITSATVTADITKNGYRLPTEAQWEYACRAGTTTAYYTGDTISDNTGWYRENSGYKTHEVGLKPANAWGLYDMHGNVGEFCWDWNDGSYYSNSPTNDPMGGSSGALRVDRGGSWENTIEFVRCANRGGEYPYYRNYNRGFRLVRP